ncbi:hypothetical protein J2S68_002065 [Glycomyces algeriensis]|nr:hypothetical protein [Glycomyces algeriensis]MDA1364489.1 hypothetical protein [Glycomyces algeriensis]MDR7350522.1 hypothetical protein [Glycomyces algeriensis]
MVERVPATDVRGQLAARGRFGDLGHPAEPPVHVEHEPQVDIVAPEPFRLGDRERDVHQAAARTQRRRHLGEPVAGQYQVERRIHIGGVLGGVVADHRRRTEPAHQVRVLRLRRRGHRRDRRQRGQQRRAHAAGGPDDEHRRTGRDLGGGQHGADREARGRERRGVLDAEPLRPSGDERGVGFEDRVLGERPGGE